MSAGFEKRKKLAYVARRYYLEDWKQSDIARELGVSRPLVSRMLSEARELGIVEITVHEPGARTARMLERLRALDAPVVLASHQPQVLSACERMIALDGPPLVQI